MLLSPSRKTCFLCCDIQERLLPGIFNQDVLLRTANKLSQVCTVLNDEPTTENKILWVATEQYPKGLGKTVADLKCPEKNAHTFEKTLFSMITDEVAECIKEYDDFVIFGGETHICVLQTANTLTTQMKKRVFIVEDGVGSMVKEEHESAIQTLRQMGCFVLSSNSFIFQLCGNAKLPSFKACSAAVKASLNTSA